MMKKSLKGKVCPSYAGLKPEGLSKQLRGVYTRTNLSLKGISFLVFCLLLVFFNKPLAWAQVDKLDLTTSPLFFEFSTEKGATIKDKIRVRNNTGRPLSLLVGLQRLSPGQNSEVELSDPKPGDEFISWLSLDSPQVLAKPREWVDIPFTLKIPETAAFGYYFAFLLTPSPPAKEAGTAKVTGGVAVPVLLNVKAPGAVASGKLIEFKPKTFINEYLPVEFRVTSANTGNIHIKPRGNIFVRSGNNDLAILEVNPQRSSILPQGQRTFESAWTDGFLVREPVMVEGKVLQDEKGNKKTRLAFNWNKLTEFRFGPYSAHLLMVYDDGTRDVALEATANFWILPYKVMTVLLLALILLVLLLRVLLRAYVAREVRKRQGG